MNTKSADSNPSRGTVCYPTPPVSSRPSPTHDNLLADSPFSGDQGSSSGRAMGMNFPIDQYGEFDKSLKKTSDGRGFWIDRLGPPEGSRVLSEELPRIQTMEELIRKNRLLLEAEVANRLRQRDLTLGDIMKIVREKSRAIPIPRYNFAPFHAIAIEKAQVEIEGLYRKVIDHKQQESMSSLIDKTRRGQASTQHTPQARTQTLQQGLHQNPNQMQPDPPNPGHPNPTLAPILAPTPNHGHGQWIVPKVFQLGTTSQRTSPMMQSIVEARDPDSRSSHPMTHSSHHSHHHPRQHHHESRHRHNRRKSPEHQTHKIHKKRTSALQGNGGWNVTHLVASHGHRSSHDRHDSLDRKVSADHYHHSHISHDHSHGHSHGRHISLSGYLAQEHRQDHSATNRREQAGEDASPRIVLAQESWSRTAMTQHMA